MINILLILIEAAGGADPDSPYYEMYLALMEANPFVG